MLAQLRKINTKAADMMRQTVDTVYDAETAYEYLQPRLSHLNNMLLISASPETVAGIRLGETRDALLHTAKEVLAHGGKLVVIPQKQISSPIYKRNLYILNVMGAKIVSPTDIDWKNRILQSAISESRSRSPMDNAQKSAEKLFSN